MNNQWNNAVQQYVRTRPLLVTILGVVSVMMGLWALCAGVVGMGVATLQLLTCSLAFGTPFKALVTGVLRLMVGSALLNGSGWARMATIIISVVNLVVILLPDSHGYGSGEFWNALLSIGMIVYMLTPGVTRWFEGR